MVDYKKAMEILELLLQDVRPKEIAYQMKIKVCSVYDIRRRFPLLTGVKAKYRKPL